MGGRTESGSESEPGLTTQHHEASEGPQPGSQSALQRGAKCDPPEETRLAKEHPTGQILYVHTTQQCQNIIAHQICNLVFLKEATQKKHFPFSRKVTSTSLS